MATIKIVYASMSGHNKAIADYLSEYFMQQGDIVDVSRLSKTDAHVLTDYDISIVVTYTFNDGDIPKETETFFETLKTVDLTNKIYGVAGSGSTKKKHFARAVDYFDATLAQTGAKKGSENVKIDQAPTKEDFKELKAFAVALLEA